MQSLLLSSPHFQQLCSHLHNVLVLLQECNRLEGQLETARQASAQQPSAEDMHSLRTALSTALEQLSTSGEQLQQAQTDLKVRHFDLSHIPQHANALLSAKLLEQQFGRVMEQDSSCFRLSAHAKWPV